MKRILFVCTENSNRSQMAEGFARAHGGDSVEVASAGSKPSGTVDPRAIAAMKERGIDIAWQSSKGLQDVGAGRWDYAVVMGCGDECPWISARHREEWDLPDPKSLTPVQYRELRDEIERRVVELLERLGEESEG